MELIDISIKIYDVKDGQVGLFADSFDKVIIIILIGKPGGALQQNSPFTPRLQQSQGEGVISDH